MKNRDYYSSRTGKLKETPELALKLLKKRFLITYNELKEDGYFQEYFGYRCINDGYVDGELGGDIDAMIFLSLKKENLWTIDQKLDSYSEDDLFDIIEFLHDHCSEPSSECYHFCFGCGHHYYTFDNTDGQQYFRGKMNYVIKDYLKGYEMSNNGEILELPDKHIAPLLEADIPSSDIENINSKIQRAVTKFRRHKSTLENRKEALRELADVLEYLKPEIKDVLDSKDEGDIFNIANNFSIRHHNQKQKKDYDKAIWYSWIFYHYLATIHAVLRMVARKN